MLKRYLPVIIVLLAFIACDKNKLNTKPSIEIKHVNTTDVLPDQFLVIDLEYKDKEGDLGNGLITYIRERLNIKPIQDAQSNDKADTTRSILPDFPKTSTGQIELKIPGSFMSEDPFDNDTMNFKIFVTDVAGNSSDTVTVGPVVDKQLP
jgi:hypothetical protein